MDPFEASGIDVRLQFVTLLSRLSSSLQSIHKCTSFALKHSSRCADDIWDCLMEECARASLNARINLLYLVDQLLDLQPTTAPAAQPQSLPYTAFAARDLGTLVNNVVPASQLGSLNLMSATQASRKRARVLQSWKTRRVFDAAVLDPILNQLSERRASMRKSSSTDAKHPEPDKQLDQLSRNDILRRIEDDRERHKRLRERIWVLPVPTTIFTISATPAAPAANATTSLPSAKPSPTSPASPSDLPQTPIPPKSLSKTTRTKQLATSETASAPSTNVQSASPTSPSSPSSRLGPFLPIEIEFNQLWDAAKQDRKDDLDHDSNHDEQQNETRTKKIRLSEIDILAMKQERQRCFVDGM
ncbi:hypothetical protein OIV83_000485 [Microbotryomycetes sp. JL201]|nr:hypothetical protein OIV83_000485 [Microbotryomycetes sp. JL201]